MPDILRDLLLASGLSFFLGVCIGAQVSAYALRARERRTSTKIRLLNRARRGIHEVYGVDISPWLIDLPEDQPDTQVFVPHQRSK